MYARRETAVNVIEARGLTKVYDGRAVVRDFAMTVAAGDIYGFVGKNGAGKSTVMKMICGDALPTAGEVVLFESDRAAAGAAGAAGPDEGGVRRIGVLIEEPGLLLNLSAYRNLMAKGTRLGHRGRSGPLRGGAQACGALLGWQQEGARVLARHEAAAGARHGAARQP